LKAVTTLFLLTESGLINDAEGDVLYAMAERVRRTRRQCCLQHYQLLGPTVAQST